MVHSERRLAVLQVWRHGVRLESHGGTGLKSRGNAECGVSAVSLVPVPTSRRAGESHLRRWEQGE